MKVLTYDHVDFALPDVKKILTDDFEMLKRNYILDHYIINDNVVIVSSNIDFSHTATLNIGVTIGLALAHGWFRKLVKEHNLDKKEAI